MQARRSSLSAKSSGAIVPDKDWVIIIAKPITRKDPKNKKKRLLVPRDYTVQRFIDEILDDSVDPYVGTMYIYTDVDKSYRLSMYDLIHEVLNKNMANDGFLYLFYTISTPLCPCG